MASKKMPKNAEKYYCESCDFKCSKLSNYNNHLLTAKHKQAYTGLHEASIKMPPCEDIENEIHECHCGMVYIHRQSLYRHRKKCQKMPKNADSQESQESQEWSSNSIESSEKVNRILPISQTFITEPPEPDMANTIQAMVNAKVEEQLSKMGDSNITRFLETQTEAQAKRDEAAAEQTRLLIEAISLNGSRSITNNTTNNQFNLNVFLNEDCKDAFTLKEVMDSIECTVTDLDRMDHDGYVATITRKILESMQNMSITERPIHCTDARRNTVCVKDDTGWERNEKAMKRLAHSVFLIGRKLGRMVDDWRVVYPDHFRGTVTRREQYHRLIADIMRVNDLDVEARIASKICKGVILDRKSIMDR